MFEDFQLTHSKSLSQFVAADERGAGFDGNTIARREKRNLLRACDPPLRSLTDIMPLKSSNDTVLCEMARETNGEGNKTR